MKAACGPDDAKFNASPSGRQSAVQPEAGKSLVYVVEQHESPRNALVTPTVRVGLDVSWVGANYGTSYLFFPIEPGELDLEPVNSDEGRMVVVLAAQRLSAEEVRREPPGGL